MTIVSTEASNQEILDPGAILFLDLEETIIDNWSNRNLLQVELNFIRDCIAKRNNDYDFRTEADYGVKHPKIVALGLFSYAIAHNADLEVFHKELQTPIEEALGLKFDHRYLMTIERIRKLFIMSENIQIKPNDSVDFVNFCGNKGKTFFTVIPFVLKGEHKIAYLVDDVVGDQDLYLLKSGIKLSTRSITNDIKVYHEPNVIRIAAEREIGMLM